MGSPGRHDHARGQVLGGSRRRRRCSCSADCAEERVIQAQTTAPRIYGAEKLAFFGAMHLASNKCSLLNLVLTQRADNTFAPGGRSKHRLLQSCHPSVGCPPLPCLTLKHAKTCDMPAKHAQTTHHGLRSDDLGRNRLSPGGLSVVGDAPAGPGERDTSADRSWLGMSADAVSACGDCAGNSALDQPGSRSSELTAGAVRAPSRSGVSVSPESK